MRTRRATTIGAGSVLGSLVLLALASRPGALSREKPSGISLCSSGAMTEEVTLPTGSVYDLSLARTEGTVWVAGLVKSSLDPDDVTPRRFFLHGDGEWYEGPTVGISGMIGPRIAGDCEHHIHAFWGEDDEATDRLAALLPRVVYSRFDSRTGDWSPPETVYQGRSIPWTPVGVGGPLLDGTGGIHIAFYDLGETGFVVRYLRWSGETGWSSTAVPAPAGGYVGLSVTPDGKVFLAIGTGTRGGDAPPNSVLVTTSFDRGTTWTPWMAAAPSEARPIVGVWLGHSEDQIRVFWRRAVDLDTSCGEFGTALWSQGVGWIPDRNLRCDECLQAVSASSRDRTIRGASHGSHPTGVVNSRRGPRRGAVVGAPSMSRRTRFSFVRSPPSKAAEFIRE